MSDKPLYTINIIFSEPQEAPIILPKNINIFCTPNNKSNFLVPKKSKTANNLNSMKIKCLQDENFEEIDKLITESIQKEINFDELYEDTIKKITLKDD
jgi:hypothetical protein